MAIHPFTSSHLQIFPSRSPVHSQPFEIFLWPFSRSPQAVRNFSLAVQPFTASHSKFFFGRSAVHRKPFEIFLWPFSRSPQAVRNFSLAVQPFMETVLNGLAIRFSSVQKPCILPLNGYPLVYVFP